MRRPSSYLSRRENIDVTMTPMIDVVFLLLIFFVWTTSIHAVEYILPSEMSAQLGSQPEAPTEITPELDFPDIVIRIWWDDGQPRWSLNQAPMASVREIAEHLTAIAEIHAETRVILHPEAEVPLQWVIEVFDQVLLAGFSQVSFAVNQ